MSVCCYAYRFDVYLIVNVTRCGACNIDRRALTHTIAAVLNFTVRCYAQLALIQILWPPASNQVPSPRSAFSSLVINILKLPLMVSFDSSYIVFRVIRIYNNNNFLHVCSAPKLVNSMGGILTISD